MSGRNYHNITRKKPPGCPTRVISIGVTPHVEPISGVRNRYLHTCASWHMVVTDYRRASPSYRRFHTYESAEEFAFVVGSVVLPGGRSVIVASDLEYTLRLCGVFKLCSEGAISVADWYEGHGTSVIKLSVGGREVDCVDLANYIGMPVQSLPYYLESTEAVRAEEGKQGEDTDDAATSSARCISVAMDSILGWLYAHARGCWATTASGIAWNLYRSRKWGKRVRIHASEEATSLERKAFRGIEAKCWYVGKYPDAVYVLDVNSAYGYVMAEMPLPVALHRYGVMGKLELYDYFNRGYGAIGMIHEYPEGVTNVSPARNELLEDNPGRQTFLAGDELLAASSYRSTTDLRECAIYEMGFPFSSYIKDIYDARQRCGNAQDVVGSRLSKMLLVTFFGRWAMKATRWEPAPWYKGSTDWGYAYDDDPKKGGLRTLRVLAGSAQIKVPSGEPYNSFPAISAYVTMYAREYVRKLMSIAGEENVIYSDTDSLHCNAVGYDNLYNAGLVDGSRLGGLKVVDITDDATYWGAKRYILRGKHTMAGLSVHACGSADRGWTQNNNSSLLHGLYRGPLDSVVVVQVPFKLGECKPSD